MSIVIGRFNVNSMKSLNMNSFGLILVILYCLLINHCSNADQKVNFIKKLTNSDKLITLKPKNYN